MVATAIVDTGQLAKGAVWAASLAVMGGACLMNAWRCGRVHCFFTGPFFVLVGLVALLFGSGVVSLGAGGWSWLGATLLIGAVGLGIVPERLWGSYRTNT